MLKALGIFLAIVVACVSIPGCTLMRSYNAFQKRDEQVKQAWSGVLNVYKKRADLVPSLVETVKGFAKQESNVLVQVTQARAAATSVKLPENASDADLAKFVAAQKELSAGLGRLLAVSEAYPTLKSDAGFLKLQAQLGSIETQASMARNRYIREVAAYNVNVRSFPSNLVAGFFGYTVKPQLEFEDEKTIKQAPKVQF